MTERTALLDAIHAHPPDDLPRLVYADWLDEHGDPARAEFIRVQCELARLDKTAPDRARLEDRAHELLSAHEPAWTGFSPDFVYEWTFERGFVAQVRFDYPDPKSEIVAALIPHAPRCLDFHMDQPNNQTLRELTPLWPTVEQLELNIHRLDTDPQWLAHFLETTPLPRLESLDIHSDILWADLAEILTRSPITHQLRSIHLPNIGQNLNPDSRLQSSGLLDALAQCPLERLSIAECDITRSELVALLNSPWASTLSSLDVAPAPFLQDETPLSEASPALRLKQLRAHGLSIFQLDSILNAPACRETLANLEFYGEVDIDQFINTGFWTRANSLRLTSSWLRTLNLNVLACSQGPQQLRLLDLSREAIGSDGLRHLTTAPWMRSLIWLGLSGNDIDDEGLIELVRSQVCTELRTLHLTQNPITDQGALALARSPSFRNLRILTLNNTQITDLSAAQLLDAPHWHLSGLGLGGVDIGPETVAALAVSPRLARLEWLNLSGNSRLGGDALMPLAKSPYLSCLCELEIYHTGVSDTVRAIFNDRLRRRVLN